MDNHTKEQRRKNMQAVKNKDSKIEQLLRKELWQEACAIIKIQNVNVFIKIFIDQNNALKSKEI